MRTLFEGQPLNGLCIAVTRPEVQARVLMAGFRELGAKPLGCPTIRIEEPADRSQVERAVRHLNDYDWVVFTSVNGVTRFWDELVRSGGDGSWAIHGDLDVPGFPLKFSEFPEELPLHAPTLGQHNEEVLTSYLGRSVEEVEQLREAGVLVKGRK